MPDNARRTGPALERMPGFIAWLVPTIQKFPGSQKSSSCWAIASSQRHSTCWSG